MNLKNKLILASLVCLAFLTSAFVERKPIEVIKPKAVEPIKVKADDQSFVEFLSLFEKVALPFEVGLDDFEKYQQLKFPKSTSKGKRKSAAGSDSQLMRKHLQDYMYIGRMGPPEVMPIARFYLNEKTIAVVYMSYRAFRHSSDRSGSEFKLSLFDLKGNPITSHKIRDLTTRTSFSLSSSSPYGQTQTFSIDANSLITQKTYKAIWKEDVEVVGLENNEVTDYVLEKTERFQIGDEGDVSVVLEGKDGDRASVD